MAELLDPIPQDINSMYLNEFVGMTREKIDVDMVFE
jgi:hypothetical protein